MHNCIYLHGRNDAWTSGKRLNRYNSSGRLAYQTLPRGMPYRHQDDILPMIYSHISSIHWFIPAWWYTSNQINVNNEVMRVSKDIKFNKQLNCSITRRFIEHFFLHFSEHAISVIALEFQYEVLSDIISPWGLHPITRA